MIAICFSLIFFCILLAPGIVIISLSPLGRRPENFLIGAIPVSVIAVHYLWLAATVLSPTGWHFIPLILGANGALAVFYGWKGAIAFDRSTLAGLAISATAVMWVLLLSIGDGMFSNDQLISWNRWASDWIGGRLPVRTYEYPQVIPIIYASVYAFFGGEQLLSVARQTASLAFLAAPMAIVATRRRSMVPTLSLMAILLYYASPWPTSGMADIPVGAFVLAAFVAAQQRQVVLGSVCIAAAALTKQSGLFFLVSYVAFVAIDQRSLRACLKAFLPALLLIAPWVIYKEIGILFGGEPSVVKYTMHGIHGNVSYLSRISNAVNAVSTQWLGNWGLLCLAALLLLSLRDRTARRLVCVAIVPYGLAYAMFFGYDARNALPLLPLISWAIGLGLAALPWPKIKEGKPMPLSGAAAAQYAVCVYLVAALAWTVTTFDTIAAPISALTEHERRESYRVGSPIVVRALRAALSQTAPECQVFTPYTSLAHSGYFKGRIRNINLNSDAAFLSVLEKNECGLLLVITKPATEYTPPSPPALRVIEKAAADGAIRLINDGGTFRIYGL